MHGAAVREPVPTERAEEFLDVERDAVGPGVDRVDDVARRRQARPEDQRRHQRRLVAAQAPEPYLLRDPLGDEPGSPFAQPGCVECLVAAIGADEEQGLVTRLAGQLRQRFEAQVVRPLEVLEDQDGRDGGSTDEIDDLHHEVTAAGDLGVQARLGDAQEVTAHRLEGRISAHRPTEVEQRRRENVAVLRSELTARDPKSALTGKLSDRPQEARLADPGLARHEQQLPVARMDLLESPLGDRDHVIPTDDHRREQRLRLRHGGSLRGDDAPIHR